VSGLEHEVARGRHQLVRAQAEGRVAMNKDIKDTLFQCLMCNACYSNCFPRIKTDEVIARARYDYITRYGQPQLQRYIFHYLLRHPEVLSRLLKLAAPVKNSGLSGLAQALRILGWFGKNLATAEQLLEKIPRKSLRELAAMRNWQPRKTRGKVAYFVGCGINFAQPEVGLATLELLTLRGFAVEILPNFCCGLPAYAYGDLDSVRWFAQQNSELLLATDADYIITDCGSCTSFLKEYHRFCDDPVQSERLQPILNKIVDLTHWLADTMDWANYKDDRQPYRVTWHDPCHLAHHLHEKASSRAVMRNIPNVSYTELPEADMCCGGAGSYNIAHSDISKKILARKLTNVVSANADILATACPACIMQLAWGVRQNGMPVRVMHLNQLVLENTVRD